MAIEVAWYLTHITRPDGTTTTWTTQTSTRVDVWFGTQAEFNATHPTGYDLVIIDEADGAPNQVDGDELRIALHHYNSSFNLSTNAGYLGTFDVDYTANGVTNPDPTVAFAVDGRGIESSRNAYLITLEPVTVPTFMAEYKGGTSHFHPFFPASLTPCFAAGTLLLTDRGARAVETLKPGDLVQTRDHGLVPLRLALVAAVSPGRLRRTPSLQPIRIGKGALEQGNAVRRSGGLASVSGAGALTHRAADVRRGPSASGRASAPRSPGHLVRLGAEQGDLFPSGLRPPRDPDRERRRDGVVLSRPRGAAGALAGGSGGVSGAVPGLRRGAGDCAAPPAAARSVATGHKARQMVRRHEANAVRLCA